MQDSKSLNQAKLILLALVKELPGISPLDLHNLAQETLFYDYFTVAEAVKTLEEQGLVELLEAKNELHKDLNGRPLRHCYLSQKGEGVLSQLYSSITPQIRKLLQSLGEQQCQKNDLEAFYQADGNGGYTVYLSAKDKGRSLLKLELQVASEDRARNFTENWPSSAIKIYQNILANLVNKKATE